MDTKRISIVVSLAILLLITACGVRAKPMTSTVTPISPNEETPTVISEPGNEEATGLVSDDSSELWPKAVITRQNAHELSEIKTIGKFGISDFVWSPNGRSIALATTTGLYLVDIRTHEQIQLSTDGDHLQIGHIITFSPDGNLLAVANRKAVEIYDIRSHELTLTLDTLDVWAPIAFSPDNATLATGYTSWVYCSVRLWDVSTGALIDELGSTDEDSFDDIAFNPDGSLLAAIENLKGQVHIWNVEEGIEEKVLTGTAGYGSTLSFSSDGRLLAAAASLYDEDVADLYLFDAGTGELVSKFEGYPAGISRVTFNVDGGVLVSAGTNGAVQLWDVETGKQLALLDVPFASSVAFSPDGTLLATAGVEDVLRIWGVP